MPTWHNIDQTALHLMWYLSLRAFMCSDIGYVKVILCLNIDQTALHPMWYLSLRAFMCSDIGYVKVIKFHERTWW